MELISVIVPVFNAQNKISKCIESILKQSKKNFEVILVDDGSTDNSTRICKRYEKDDKRVRVICQENQGVSRARNTGLRYAKGKYIAFVDSDDYVDTDYLEQMYLEIIRSNTELVISGITFQRENSLNSIRQSEMKILDSKIQINKEERYIAELLQTRRLNYVYAKLYRTDIIKRYNIKFKEHISLGEDTIFVMDYLRCINTLSVINSFSYHYIKYSSGTLSTQKSLDIYNQHCFINRYIKQTFIETRLMNNSIKKCIDGRIIESALWSLHAISDNKRNYLKEKNIQILKIFENEELHMVLDRNKDLMDNSKELQYIYAHKIILWKVYVLIQKLKCNTDICLTKFALSKIGTFLRRIKKKCSYQ